MGRVLVTFGLFLVAAGLLLLGLERIGLPLGRLPGDLSYRGKSFQVFAPLGTSLLLSALLTLAFLLLSKLRR